MRDDLAAKIIQYVNRHDPLGPSDAAKIKNDEVAAALFDPHNKSFNNLLRSDLSIVTGRRGSGKTALLKSYRYRNHLQSTPRGSGLGDFDLHNYRYVIDITAHKQFELMQRRVAGDYITMRLIESVIGDWSLLLRTHILSNLLARNAGESDDQDLQIISRYLRQHEILADSITERLLGDTIAKKIRSIFARGQTASADGSGSQVDLEKAWSALLSFLKKRGQRMLMVFDSMDEYDIENRAFNRTVGALMRFIASFNSENEEVKIKLGLPVEVYPEIQEASANPLKDMVSVDQVRWTSNELAQIAAFRYRLFLNIHDKPTARLVERFDLSKRSEMKKFWQTFMPSQVTNRYGFEEEPLTYIMQHTQLLPRQLFMLLQGVVKESVNETGGYRRFSPRAVSRSVENIEPIIAQEIIGAYSFVYPFAGKLGRALFGNFPTLFSYSQLEDCWRKRGRAYMAGVKPDFDLTDLKVMLVRMCVVGAKVDEGQYITARFSYHGQIPFNVGEGHELCLHPVFSSHFNASLNERRKAILPIGTELGVDNELDDRVGF